MALEMIFAYSLESENVLGNVSFLMNSGFSITVKAVLAWPPGMRRTLMFVSLMIHDAPPALCTASYFYWLLRSRSVY